MSGRARGHDLDELVVNAGLVLLAQAFRLVKVGEDVGVCLVCGQVAADALPEVRDEGYDEGQRLAGEGEVLCCDVLEAGDAGGACA